MPLQFRPVGTGKLELVGAGQSTVVPCGGPPRILGDGVDNDEEHAKMLFSIQVKSFHNFLCI